MQFVVEMLRLPQSSWLDHLKELAVTKGVIVEERAAAPASVATTTTYKWNRDLAQNEHTATLLESLNNGGTRSDRQAADQSTRKPRRERDRKRKRFHNLDEAINELITDKTLHVSLSPTKIRTEAELDRAMKRVVDMLLAAGVGYEDEGELFVTKQGRTAFVRTDPEVVIHKIKLRRCALNGDWVRVFIFKDSRKASEVIDEIARLSGAESDEDDEDRLDEVALDAEVVEELSKCSATGFVVRVLKEVHPRTCVGQFSVQATHKSKNLVFFPHERGVPPVNVAARHLDAFIPKDTQPEDYFKELSQRLFEVELTSCNSFYAIFNGRPVTDVGMKGNIMDENTCILLRHGFKKHCMDRLERLGESYVAKAVLGEDADEAAKRRDLTSMCIFTIDPATAKDLDDAVSCRQLENGNVEVGIHISDVTSYVHEGSDLDQLVQQAKTTSVYMVDAVYHMLPSTICNICSLLPGERKRAVSVFVEMTPRAEVVSTSFTRSLINSCAQLSYEQAQKIIDDEDPLSVAPLTIYNQFTAADLRGTIKTLHKLSRFMRDRRMANGALKFDKPKYYFRLDADKQPLELLSEMSKPANHLIEEFMILANQVVGKFIFEKYPRWAILRQHSPPKLDQMAKVRSFFRDLEFPELQYGTAKQINASMAAILAECDRRQLDREGFELVLNGLLAKPMNRAQYFCTGDERYADKFDHFALSIPFYTHFTSPIRRYPDILVHRLLLRALSNLPAPKTWHLADVNSLMGDCNRQKMMSRYASEDSSRLFLAHYLSKKFPEGKEMKATVCNVLQHSIEVKLWQTGDELNVSHADLEADGRMSVKKLEDGIVVKAKEGGAAAAAEVTLKVFSTCLVRVTVVKEHLRATLLLI